MKSANAGSNTKHYIGMNGTSGCLPDSCNAYRSNANAVESLASLLELSKRQTAELQASGYVQCRQSQGADYAEIVECQCDRPWEHGEMDEEANWLDEDDSMEGN